MDSLSSSDDSLTQKDISIEDVDKDDTKYELYDPKKDKQTPIVEESKGANFPIQFRLFLLITPNFSEYYGN